jgi:methylmalonyl-CoA epimerase
MSSGVRIGGVVHAVADMDAAIAQYSAILGIEPEFVHDNEGAGLRVGMFRTEPTFVELWAPTREGPVKRWVDEHNGGGLYLLSFHVDDVPATVERLRDAEVRLMGDPGPGNAVEGMVYVHPKALSGVLGLLYPHE